MYVPVPTGTPTQSAPALDEPRDMAVAIRLLSGKDCERDATTAHVMLVRLSESRTPVVREEAARILKAGAANAWFTEKTPKFYELERIAEKTLARRDRNAEKTRLMVSIGIGLAALFGGLTAFMVQSDSGNFDVAGQAVIAVIIVLLLVGLVFFKMTQRDRA